MLVFRFETPLLIRKRVKRATKNLQERLHNLCWDYAGGQKTLAEFLRAVGNCVRWKQ
ncbi:hypothetical protein DPMN_157390 [Dreissena polymorpha]|uniref:Uncharacterized protein n=1 Tax=Dreissena polymorpha TaxID=45954 RepID=A0A9D4INU1_DREPO|nr:hypothetical protein DPMN_157390 [Dreissena polymorpha]